MKHVVARLALLTAGVMMAPQSSFAQTLWTFSGTAQACSGDGNGNFALVESGTGGESIWEYNSSGREGTYTFQSAAGSTLTADAVGFDSSSNVYVAYTDVVTLPKASRGTYLYIQEYPAGIGTNGPSQVFGPFRLTGEAMLASCMTVDVNGNVWVGGTASGTTNGMFAVGYTSSGVQTPLQAVYAGTSSDKAFGINEDSGGNILLSGELYNSYDLHYNPVVVKYNPSGSNPNTPIWAHSYQVDSSAMCYCFYNDTSYIAGYQRPPNYNINSFVASFPSNGTGSSCVIEPTDPPFTWGPNNSPYQCGTYAITSGAQGTYNFIPAEALGGGTYPNEYETLIGEGTSSTIYTGDLAGTSTALPIDTLTDEVQMSSFANGFVLVAVSGTSGNQLTFSRYMSSPTTTNYSISATMLGITATSSGDAFVGGQATVSGSSVAYILYFP